MSLPHYYGDEDFSDEMFSQVEEAAWYIGINLARWGRIGVMQTKEKFGGARVYCHLGLSCFHSIIFPRHCWIHKWWPYKADLTISKYIMPLINFIVVPIQKSIYRYVYQQAVNKWPHLAEEILVDADFGELLNGVVMKRYKHSDYWKTL